MGYRTVVMLSNDFAHEWENDTELGKKISTAMNYSGRTDERVAKARLGSYGEVVQCVHGDTQSLVLLDGYTMFNELSSKCWFANQEQEDVAVDLLKAAADKLGYKLVKKPTK